MREHLYIWVTLLGRNAEKNFKLLVDSYGSLENAWEVNKRGDITKSIEENQLLWERLLDERIKEEALKYSERIRKMGIKMTHLYKEDYPEHLKTIYDPPFVMYYYGKLPGEMPLLSVVGSRKCTAYGRQVSYDLSKNIAECGVGIVSGLARGIDSRAHAGALDAEGYTIAVLGGGPDNIYPPENEVLYHRIKENGLILSEYLPGSMPLKHHFPARNRIIAGLSLGTLVIEAGVKSGAMITVNFALSEGRDVFSVPGNIDSIYSEGCNRLIKSGSYIVTGYTDVLEVLGICRQKKIQGSCGWLSGLEREEALVCDLIYRGVNTPEEICKELNAECSRIIAVITMLEVKGIIGRDKNGRSIVLI